MAPPLVYIDPRNLKSAHHRDVCSSVLCAALSLVGEWWRRNNLGAQARGVDKGNAHSTNNGVYFFSHEEGWNYSIDYKEIIWR